MSRPLLAIALSLMAGTALGHFLFYEWGYGAWAELRPWLPTWLWRRSVQGSALLGMTFWS